MTTCSTSDIIRLLQYTTKSIKDKFSWKAFIVGLKMLQYHIQQHKQWLLWKLKLASKYLNITIHCYNREKPWLESKRLARTLVTIQLFIHPHISKRHTNRWYNEQLMWQETNTMPRSSSVFWLICYVLTHQKQLNYFLFLLSVVTIVKSILMQYRALLGWLVIQQHNNDNNNNNIYICKAQ